MLQRVASTNTKQVRQWEQQTATKGPPVGTKDSDGEGSAKVLQWEQEANAGEVQRSSIGNMERTRGKCKGPPVGTRSEREGSAKVRQRDQEANARVVQRSTSGNRQRPRGKRKGPPVGMDSDRERSARPGLRGRAQRGTDFNHQRASEERNLSISERAIERFTESGEERL